MCWRAWTAVLVVAVVGSAACRGSDSATPTGTDPTAAQTTTTTDPYAVPDVIDAAYVNRVLAGLAQVEGDVLRIAIRENAFPQEAWDRLRAIYADDGWLDFVVDSYLLEIRSSFAGISPTPGNKVIHVVSLENIDARCIFAEVAIDYSSTALEPEAIPGGHWVALVPVPADIDPDDHNPTGWAYAYDGYPDDGSPPANKCLELSQ